MKQKNLEEQMHIEKQVVKVAPQALKEEAADIVRNTMPNYAYVGDFVRTMRVTPFGNFMSLAIRSI